MTLLDASLPIGPRRMAGPLSIWGKLPSEADLLCHRTTPAQARSWRDWVDRVWSRRPGAQEGQRRHALAWTAAGRASPPPRTAPSDLADLPVAFVMQPGTLPFAPRHCVQGVAIASSDRAGNVCPLIVFRLINRPWLRRSCQADAAAHRHGDVLHALARLAGGLHAVTANGSTLFRAVDALDELHRPGWRHWLSDALPVPSRLQFDTWLHDHAGDAAADLAADLQGVTHMPLADWPSQILRRRRSTAAFWQQDARGRPVDASNDLAQLGTDVGPETIPTASGNMASGLQLVGLQHGGMASGFRWTWGEGPDTRGLDGILRERAGLASIVLHRIGMDERSGWWISNQGAALPCAINDQLLVIGDQQRLGHGDVIEVGSTRLRVQLEASPDMDMAGAPARSGHDPDAAHWPAFDLASLAAPRHVASVDRASGMPLGRSDLGDPIALDPADRRAPVALDVGTPEDLLPTSPQDGSASRPTGEELLAALHARYLTKLRDPNHEDEQTPWQDLMHIQQSTQTDPMAHWMALASEQREFDLRSRYSKSIATLLQGAPAPDAVDVLAPKPFENVLHLFAPENLRRRNPSAVPDGLPGLTRREHHSLSLDSAMPLPEGRADPPNDPPAGADR